MEKFSTCQLREKEVINVCDGTRLGCPSDFEFNVYHGVITAIIVPRPSGFLGLSHANDLVIPWDNIECIGKDTILVRIYDEKENNICNENKIRKYL